MRTAIFIERDGVLNHTASVGQSRITPRTVDELVLNKTALKPLQLLKDAGFMLIATTNQPGIARGHIIRRELDLMHLIIQKAFPLDDILMCLHDEADRCPCRKPNPGLFREGAFKWQIDLDQSFVISDKWQDAKAAQIAGCTSILLESPWNGTDHHDFVAPNLQTAAAKVLQLYSQRHFGCVSA